MSETIPKRGYLTFEFGDLVAKFNDGTEAGRFFVGPGGLTYQGELTVFQRDDPPKLRLCSSYSGGRGGLGCVSFNILRDGDPEHQEEVAYLGGTTAEDVNGPGQYRGQVEIRVRGTDQAEPQLAWVISDAYTAAEFGVPILRNYVKDPIVNLWKWSY